MIHEINEHIIETSDIEQITPIYTDYGRDDACDCFKIYLRISFVVVRGENLKEKRDELVRVWREDGV